MKAEGSTGYFSSGTAQSNLGRTEGDMHAGSAVTVPVTVRGGHVACQHCGSFSQTVVCGLSGGQGEPCVNPGHAGAVRSCHLFLYRRELKDAVWNKTCARRRRLLAICQNCLQVCGFGFLFCSRYLK